MSDDRGYVLADADEQTERERLRHLEAWLDPITVRRLEATGVGTGWRCLEAGAGGGSIAGWLGQRVGTSGSVLATDIDVRYLIGQPANVEVRRHDMMVDAFDAGAFDLVHCRTVLGNVSDSRVGFHRLAEAVAPGGWLVVEESDFGVLTIAGVPDAARATNVMREILSRLAEGGAGNADFGREVPGLVHGLGLEAIGFDAVTGIGVPGDSVYEIIRLAWPSIQRAGAAVGLGESDLGCLEAALESASCLLVVQTLFGAWGRKPR